MKIVVIGGTGLIGSNLANRLRMSGHTVVAAAPSTGVNAVTGDGLDDALKGADVVVDVSNSPSTEDRPAMKFFQTVTANLINAGNRAGVKHHVALSVVGADRLPDSGYLRAKIAMEDLIKRSGVPYSILRSTQFYEFVSGIVQSGTKDGHVYIPTALFQPISSDEVVGALSEIVVGRALNGTVEVAGPALMKMSDFVAYYLDATDDPRIIEPNKHARYFGAELTDESLVPGKDARLGLLKFTDWINVQALKC